MTKTKASHHTGPSKAAVVEKATWPTTFEGKQLATDVNASGLSAEAKARLVREIMEYEGSHGKCTQTFTKKIRKQIR